MENTSEKIKAALQKEELGQYILLFKENNLFDYAALSEMKDEDYEKIGIKSIGDRKKLISMFSKENKSSAKGCLIPSIILLVVLTGIVILLHFMGILPSIKSTLETAGIVGGIFLLIFLRIFF